MISLPTLVNREWRIENRKQKSIHRKAFTLIELLVVIGILTVLFAIVLIAVNPGRQFAQANNTQRRSDVNAILNAIHQYGASNKGVLPAGIDTTLRELCIPALTCATAPATATVDICASLVPTYLAALPTDPQTAVPFVNCISNYDTRYSVQSTGAAGGNRITVTALTPELSEVITVTR